MVAVFCLTPQHHLHHFNLTMMMMRMMVTMMMMRRMMVMVMMIIWWWWWAVTDLYLFLHDNSVKAKQGVKLSRSSCDQNSLCVQQWWIHVGSDRTILYQYLVGHSITEFWILVEFKHFLTMATARTLIMTMAMTKTRVWNCDVRTVLYHWDVSRLRLQLDSNR